MLKLMSSKNGGSSLVYETVNNAYVFVEKYSFHGYPEIQLSYDENETVNPDTNEPLIPVLCPASLRDIASMMNQLADEVEKEM